MLACTICRGPKVIRTVFIATSSEDIAVRILQDKHGFNPEEQHVCFQLLPDNQAKFGVINASVCNPVR